MVRSESADEDQMKMDMLDDLDDDCLDVDTVDGPDSLPAAVRMRAWTDAGGRVMGGSGGGSASVSPSNHLDGKTGNADIDRRIRRQIANCNERRRMQSINAGFQSLRALLPRKEGEKLSKAAILQQTAELIQQLRAERTRFLERSGSSEEDTLTSGSPSAVWKKPRLERESDSFESIPSSSSSSAASSQNNIAAAAAAQVVTTPTTPSGLVAAAAASAATQQLQHAATIGDVTPALVEQLQNEVARERVMRVYLESKLSSMGSSSTSTPTPLSPLPSFAGFSQLALQSSPLLDSTRLLADRSPLSTMAAAAALASAAAADAAAAAQQQQSVIRPTPQQLQQQQQAALQPLRVDVSLANLVSLTTTGVQPPLSAAQQPVSTLPSALTHRSLTAIIEAIRHLEGVASASSSPPPPHSNLLVR